MLSEVAKRSRLTEGVASELVTCRVESEHSNQGVLAPRSGRILRYDQCALCGLTRRSLPSAGRGFMGQRRPTSLPSPGGSRRLIAHSIRERIAELRLLRPCQAPLGQRDSSAAVTQVVSRVIPQVRWPAKLDGRTLPSRCASYYSVALYPCPFSSSHPTATGSRRSFNDGLAAGQAVQGGRERSALFDAESLR